MCLFCSVEKVQGSESISDSLLVTSEIGTGNYPGDRKYSDVYGLSSFSKKHTRTQSQTPHPDDLY